MADSKQQLLLEYIVNSPDTFALCKTIIRPEYFNPEYRKVVEFIHKYYDKYNSVPDHDQINVETSTELAKRTVTRDQLQYCADEVEVFCRRKALEKAVLASPALIEKGDYAALEQTIRDAIAVSLDKDMGVDYFSNPTDRLEGLLVEPPRTTTKWRAFDDMIGGGLSRTELTMFSANSGGGKSVVLANLALNLSTQGLNVLYVSLELSETMIAQRFDMMLTGIPTVAWRNNYKEIAASLEQISPHMGKLVIKRMPSGTSASTIRAYLKEFELKNDYVPDVLIIDYLDIMGANERVSADNVFEKDKRSAEQLRDILFDYNMFGLTASQQNRSAIDVEAQALHQGIIAGGISKVNTVDNYCSVILTPKMKAEGVVGFTFLKTRSSDGVGKTIYLDWDNDSLRIANPSQQTKQDAITQRVAEEPKKRSLTDFFDD